ncbi:hypothetical protein BCR42DRAFT_137420 [Absidia repens]|uniref:Uncharacterized protein n=1 Tax=Absidia repens TaxID=90262 RepID=A0A1X2IWT2_9FUNG|nr:hypothetical protein BCR42DRAFT_137420 [Absidia repens]
MDSTEDDENYALKRYITTPSFTEQRPFGRTAPPKKNPSRFLQKQQSNTNQSLSSNNNNHHHQPASYSKKHPVTIHPVLDKAHVPYLQPLAVILVHDDPCMDIIFDDDGDDGDGDDDDDNGDGYDDLSIYTTDRRGCVRKWCK